jgi:hypothetical protein
MYPFLRVLQYVFFPDDDLFIRSKHVTPLNNTDLSIVIMYLLSTVVLKIKFKNKLSANIKHSFLKHDGEYIYQNLC